MAINTDENGANVLDITKRLRSSFGDDVIDGIEEDTVERFNKLAQSSAIRNNNDNVSNNESSGEKQYDFKHTIKRDQFEKMNIESERVKPTKQFPFYDKVKGIVKVLTSIPTKSNTMTMFKHGVEISTIFYDKKVKTKSGSKELIKTALVTSLTRGLSFGIKKFIPTVFESEKLKESSEYIADTLTMVAGDIIIDKVCNPKLVKTTSGYTNYGGVPKNTNKFTNICNIARYSLSSLFSLYKSAPSIMEMINVQDTVKVTPEYKVIEKNNEVSPVVKSTKPTPKKK